MSDHDSNNDELARLEALTQALSGLNPNPTPVGNVPLPSDEEEPEDEDEPEDDEDPIENTDEQDDEDGDEDESEEDLLEEMDADEKLEFYKKKARKYEGISKKTRKRLKNLREKSVKSKNNKKSKGGDSPYDAPITREEMDRSMLRQAGYPKKIIKEIVLYAKNTGKSIVKVAQSEVFKTMLEKHKDKMRQQNAMHVRGAKVAGKKVTKNAQYYISSGENPPPEFIDPNNPEYQKYVLLNRNRGGMRP